MSAIDQYQHRFLGSVHCPSDYDIVYNSPTREVCVYELLEDVPFGEKDFDGKKGDVLVGGGGGEVPALRMSMPKCLHFFVLDEFTGFENYDELFKIFWTPTQAFKLCNGFAKVGWNADRPIEFWLVENVCKVLVNEIDKFRPFGNGKHFDTPLSWTSRSQE